MSVASSGRAMLYVTDPSPSITMPGPPLLASPSVASDGDRHLGRPDLDLAGPDASGRTLSTSTDWA